MTRRHQSWIEVDLDAIAHNSRCLVERLGGVELCAVVKADAYGHGAAEVAKAAIAGGATWLAVAFTSEGVALREAGITAPILLLFEPTAAEMEAVVKFDLTPNVFTHSGIDALSAAVGASSVQGAFGCHVEVDTGMTRSGLAPGDALSIRDHIDRVENVKASGIFMHYANADINEHHSNAMQELRFKQVIEEWDPDESQCMVHALNSAAFIRGRHHDLKLGMARVGILVYGLTSGQFPKPRWLRPALSVKSAVGLVKRVPAGESLSYGHRYRLLRDSNIATIPFGYADGLPRTSGDHGAQVLIRGKRFPIAGTVTMDQILVDCGNEPIERGDEVVLIGEQGGQALWADDVVPPLGFTPLEFIARLGQRPTRVYVGKLANSTGLSPAVMPSSAGTAAADSGATSDDVPKLADAPQADLSAENGSEKQSWSA